ncbi:hypothetical protein TNCT_146371 [Trichonephila clavata]|uniref:Uncharacterized protein n=1 Tax=Trichonephila clavata TaxID=2740835 RepID=A0A8X6JQH0_TRICU|nr:hypothetical protein TNCT_146371 [Trichonephila clavata]
MYDVAESKLRSVTKRLLKENIYEVYDDILRQCQKEELLLSELVMGLTMPNGSVKRPIVNGFPVMEVAILNIPPVMEVSMPNNSHDKESVQQNKLVRESAVRICLRAASGGQKYF